MSTNLEYREIEIQRKRESRWQTSDAQLLKERQRARARDKIQLTFFCWKNNMKIFWAVRKWEMLAATTVKMSGSEKKKQKQVRHFFIKRLTRKFMEVSRCICAKQRQRNVQNKVHFFAAFLLLDPLLFFRRSRLTLPLSITRFYILFEQTINIIESLAFSPG